jgi:phosphoribosylformylglycinamidine synthase II
LHDARDSGDGFFRGDEFAARRRYNPAMIYRIDVRAAGTDPVGLSVRQQIAEMGLPARSVISSRIFLIDSDMDAASARKVASELLADPLVDSFSVISSPPDDNGKKRIEVHLKPGVMDPVAASTEMAISDMGLPVRQVRTGRAFLIDGDLDRSALDRIARGALANGVIESVHFEAHLPTRFETGRPQALQIRRVELRELSDEQLMKLSRQGHLFLSLAEMKAIQSYFRQQRREPTDIELETIAQTWSEHCVHKTLKSAVEVEDADGKNRRRYGNLIKETIFAATRQLMEEEGGRDPFCLSVFADNAGVVVFDQTDAVCFKVETHNHPSAIEPYGGSATGAGGVIRDILGTGLSAKPIANTDVFCVAHPDYKQKLPKGVIHPKRVLQQVVAGVRDYGNRMGIPTVNGAVYFDDRYLGNPLVFCGCVGLIPRDKIEKAAKMGDAIVLLGGRTGRDGVHGATFSSAELTDTHADEFSHAVQIGNAITEKKMADVILAARDLGLFHAVTDCGAGGLSSAVGEMGGQTGALVELDKVPLKYAGLRHDEIWISEAQERMTLAVPREKVAEILRLAASEDVEATVIGHFGTETRELILRYGETEVGRLSMEFLHEGLPKNERKAVVSRSNKSPGINPWASHDFKDRLLSLLSSPNIASKHWIIRQYDHEVQGGSVIKPLIGPLQIGPSDAAVLRPKLDTYRGIAIGCGMCPSVEDPYDMAIASIDEAVRNVVAVGGNLEHVAILDNFCWPSVDDARTMGTLVAACEACRDAALAFRIPFISGKDSLHNQFTNHETGDVLRIPNTLLISALSVIDDVRKCVTMDFKAVGSRVCLVCAKDDADLKNLAAMHRGVAAFIASGNVLACHDVSDGGIAVALAEMCIASGIGVKSDSEMLTGDSAFTERPGRYLIELAGEKELENLRGSLADVAEATEIGRTQSEPEFLGIPLAALTAAWRGTLDW